MSAELVGRDDEMAAVADAARPSDRLVEDRRARAVSARPRSRSRPADGSATPDGVARRRRLAGPARDGDDGRRGGRRRDRRAGRHGGEAALFERLRASAAVVILDNCEHVVDAVADLAVRLLDACPGCGSCAPARSRSTSTARRPSSSRRSRWPTPSSCSRAEPRPHGASRIRTTTTRSRTCAVARRAAAGDRARGGPHQDAVDRGDHPPPRRPLQRAERPDQPPARAPPGAAVDDRLELRPAVPRRPAGPVGARHLRRRRTARRRRVRPRGARRARAAPRSTCRPARQPLAGDRRRRCRDAAGPLPAARQHPGVRARRDGARPGCPSAPSPRTPRGSPTPPAPRPTVCAARDQAEHLAFARRERANIDAALAWSASTTRCARSRSLNGFGWAWVVLGDSRGRAAPPHRRSTPSTAAPSPRDRGRRPAARGVDRGVDRRPRLGASAHRDGAARSPSEPAMSICRPAALLPGLRRVPRRRVASRRWSSPTGAPRSTTRSTARGTRPPTPSSPREPRSRAGDDAQRPTARASRSSAGCERSTIRGCTSAARPSTASWPASSTASTTPSPTSAAPLETSRALGFRQTEAYQLSSLGRAQCQAGDYPTGAATLELALAKAEATGDVRLAALVRVHLGRVLRALGEAEAARARRSRPRRPGTGPRAAASRPRSASASSPRSTRPTEFRMRPDRLAALLDDARRRDDAPGRGVRPRRPGPPRRRAGRWRDGAASSRRTPIAAWPTPRTSSPSATASTPTRCDRTADPGPTLGLRSAASGTAPSATTQSPALSPPSGLVHLAGSAPGTPPGPPSRWRCPPPARPGGSRPAAGTTTPPPAPAARPARSRWCRSGSSSARRPAGRWPRRPTANVSSSM